MYNPDNLRSYCGPGGRVIMFGFFRAVGIMIARFVEVAASHPEHRFDNIIFVSLPFPDVISRAGGLSELEAHKAATGEDVCCVLWVCVLKPPFDLLLSDVCCFEQESSMQSCCVSCDLHPSLPFLSSGCVGK